MRNGPEWRKQLNSLKTLKILEISLNELRGTSGDPPEVRDVSRFGAGEFRGVSGNFRAGSCFLLILSVQNIFKHFAHSEHFLSQTASRRNF